MRAIINNNGKLIEGDFKSLDGLTVEWQASDGAIPQALLAAIAAQDIQPDPIAAYEALAASGADPLSLYSKVLAIASRANTSVSADVAISVNTQATLLATNLTLGRWSPGIIAGTNAVLLNLQTTLNSTGVALTADNIAWVNSWIDAHGLGLDHLS